MTSEAIQEPITPQVAPKTPASVRQKINADVNAALRVAEVRERFERLGIEPVGGSEEGFAQLLKTEHARLEQIIRSRNIEIQ